MMIKTAAKSEEKIRIRQDFDGTLSTFPPSESPNRFEKLHPCLASMSCADVQGCDSEIDELGGLLHVFRTAGYYERLHCGSASFAMCWLLIKAVSPSERQSADDVTEDDDVTADDDVTVDTRSWSGAHTGKKERLNSAHAGYVSTSPSHKAYGL